MKTIPSCGFSRAVTSAPEPAKVLASSSHKTPSPDKPIPGYVTVKNPYPGSGILTGFPFDGGLHKIRPLKRSFPIS
ncbi:hypothetical protein [Phaffia rhodozyma]|uniref:Uncharacterized protein n=1 Tax=Phaffia rhodozyma TaxID=264483 RepID=A0A0F7SKY4_PHARH|nr:hypothetical protein [Phaffia rhodozyma]